MTQQHWLHQAITGSQTTIIFYLSKHLGFVHFLPPHKIFQHTRRNKQSHSTLCSNLYSRGYLGYKMLLFSNTTSSFKAFVLQSRRIPGDYYWTHGSVQQIPFYSKRQQNPDSKSTQYLGFFSLNKVSSLLQITKPLVSYQNKMNCHHYAMDHFSLTILYVSSCRFVSFHNKCIMLRTCCISCWDSDSKRFPRMGADCAGDASIQHSISNGIIISIKPFKFSAEDRPFSALSITFVRDLNNKSKTKKKA